MKNKKEQQMEKEETSKRKENSRMIDGPERGARIKFYSYRCIKSP